MARYRYIGSDYAGLEAGSQSFYYGYEYDESNPDGEEGWGFIHEGPVATQITRMSYKQAKAQYPDCPDRFETPDCLLWFIALMIEQECV